MMLPVPYTLELSSNRPHVAHAGRMRLKRTRATHESFPSLQAPGEANESSDAERGWHVFRERPRAADSLVDSIGIDVDLVHIHDENVATEGKLVRALGVRHIRIPILEANDHYDDVVRHFLDASGTMADGLTNCAPPLGPYQQAAIMRADIQSFQTAIGGRLELVEAINEPDAARDPEWASDTRACMALQANALPGVSFIAPAIANGIIDGPLLGDISSSVDYGNIHRYYAGRNPGTRGWGGTVACGVYGALSWATCEARLNSGTKPLIITETGYNSTTEVDEETQATYLSRVVMLDQQSGIVRTYIYSLSDYPQGDGFGGDGILHVDLKPKPAYRTLANLVRLFEDPGSRSHMDEMVFQLHETDESLKHAIFVRKSGTLMMVLWRELPIMSESKATIVVSPEDVGIRVPSSFQFDRAERLRGDGSIGVVNVRVQGAEIAASINGEIAVLEFTIRAMRSSRASMLRPLPRCTRSATIRVSGHAFRRAILSCSSRFRT